MSQLPDAPRRSLATCAAVAVWLGSVAGGFALWERYDSTPGDDDAGAAARPPSGRRWEVVMFLHPRCPCAGASIREFADAVRGAGPDVAVRVEVVRPPGTPAGWECGRVLDLATAVAGAQVHCDAGGALARRAGATTSGHVVVYDQAGGVAFQGGVTRGRGRVGDNAGRQAVAGILRGEPPGPRKTPVFGCPLFDIEACPGAGGCEGGAACTR